MKDTTICIKSLSTQYIKTGIKNKFVKSNEFETKIIEYLLYIKKFNA